MTEQKITEDVSSNNCSLVVFAALIASIGGVLFGYDIGIISGALLQLKKTFLLSYFEQELIVSGVLIGALCASFIGGNLVDSFGRKTGIVVSSGLFLLGSIVLCLSTNLIMLIIGRFIVGLAISLSVTAECTYISEISPPSNRGMMVSFNEVGITTGFLLAYLVNYSLISVENGWRYMFAIAIIPAILQMVGVAFMPNSHYYLLVKGRVEEARKVLSRLRNCVNIEKEIEAIVLSINEQKNCNYVDLFSSAFNMRSRMCLGMALVILQQFSGNANVLYYAPTVFQQFGFRTDTSATLVSIGLGVVKVVSTIVTVCIVDKVGRRSLLLCGSLLMAVSIVFLGIVGTVENSHITAQKGDWTPENLSNIIETKIVYPNIIHSVQVLNMNAIRYHLITNASEETEHNETFSSSKLNNFAASHKTKMNEIHFYKTEDSSDRNCTKNESLCYPILEQNSSIFDNRRNLSEPVSFLTEIVSVISLMVFVCAYSMSYGPVTWLVLSEIFPGSLRGRAVSVATCMNWASNIVVSLTFLDVLGALTIGPTFIIYGIISFGAAIFIFFCVPETKNKSLEEINYALSKGMLQKNWKNVVTCYQGNYSLNPIQLDVERNTSKT